MLPRMTSALAAQAKSVPQSRRAALGENIYDKAEGKQRGARIGPDRFLDVAGAFPREPHPPPVQGEPRHVEHVATARISGVAGAFGADDQRAGKPCHGDPPQPPDAPELFGFGHSLDYRAKGRQKKGPPGAPFRSFGIRAARSRRSAAPPCKTASGSRASC